MTQPHPQPKECYDGTPCIDGKSDACNICYIPLQCGEKVSCKLHTICRYCVNDCFNYNPDYKCDFDTRTHTPTAQAARKDEREKVLDAIEKWSDNEVYGVDDEGYDATPVVPYLGLEHMIKSLREGAP